MFFKHIAVRSASYALFTAVGLLVASACSSSAGGGTTGTGGSGGGAVGGPSPGPADAHCGTKVHPTTKGVCPMGTGGGGAGGAGTGGSGGMGGMMSDFGDTLYGTQGDDDDCKYHVTWTSSPIREHQNVTFTLSLVRKEDGQPAVGAVPDIEAFLNDTHPAPNSKQVPSETSPGHYTAGPIQFDAPGKWTVRFHFYEQCNDGDTSPHGHAAFYVDVP